MKTLFLLKVAVSARNVHMLTSLALSFSGFVLACSNTHVVLRGYSRLHALVDE